jgi:hypothetical protein
VVATSLDLPVYSRSPLSQALHDYLASVADACGVGPESCTVDLDTPASAYVALDWRLPRFPERDLALLWDERHGWAAAIETHSGEDLIVLSYLGGDTVTPAPHVVAGFVKALRDGDPDAGRPDPPAIRMPAGNQDLLDQFVHIGQKGG